MAMTDERSAVLLIRVWLEGEDDAFRARVTAMGVPPDGTSGEETTVAVTASPGDVLTAVEHWLEDFFRGSREAGGN